MTKPMYIQIKCEFFVSGKTKKLRLIKHTYNYMQNNAKLLIFKPVMKILRKPKSLCDLCANCRN